MKPVRNLAVFIDGTDCDFGKSARQQWSNVARLYTAGERLLLEGGRQQVAQYLAETDWQAWESASDDSDPDEDLAKIARRMKAKGFIVEDIAEITGLTAEEIEGL